MEILLADLELPTIEVPGGLGPWAKSEALKEPGSILASILSMALGVMTLGAAIWFLFQVIVAGYNYLSAGGDREKLVNAGRKLTNSIIGLTIVIAAYALIALMGKLFGIDFLDIKGAIDSLTNGG